jgi:DNA-directed RNA polymerase subunit RPC12/RpoP
MTLPVSLTCPGCAREFRVPAGHLISMPIACTHCRSRVDLSHSDRLALWDTHVRLSGLPVDVGDSLLGRPQR